MGDLISVIIPIYNSKIYITDCIQSVQKQTYSNIEVLIVDDGSVDGSKKICEEIMMKDQRICYLFQSHQGVSAARNTGIKASKGKYLFFLDSDDLIHSELLQILYQLLEEYNAIMATEYYCCEEEDLHKLEETINNPNIFSEKEAFTHTYLVNQKVMYEFLVHGMGGIGGKMIRREALEFIKFDENLITGEDTKLIYQLIIGGGDAIILHQNWYYYRQHENKKNTIRNIRSIYESVSYICNSEVKYGRINNAILYERYIIKCILNWKIINRKVKDREIEKYLNEIMHAEKRKFIFSKINLHRKIEFYSILYCYPLFDLKQKMLNIWKKNILTFNKKKEITNIEEKIRKIEGKVSVIIPIYNSEAYIRRCLQSVISQTYSNLEIILIDDGSTDRGIEICKELKLADDRILIFSQEHKGVSTARNKGLSIATGKYIFFLDSDDAIHRLLLEELVCQAENEHTEIALCEYLNLYPVWMEKILESISDKDERPQWKIIEGSESEEWIHKKYYNSLNRVGMLIRKEAIDTLRYDQNLIYGKEALFIYNLTCKQLKIAYSTKEWYYHQLYSDKEKNAFEKIKDETYVEFYRIIRDKELQRGHSNYALLWERRLVWKMRQEYTFMKGRKYEEERCILRKQAFIERKNRLFKKLAFTAKLLFYCCFFCHPLYLAMKKPVILIDKAIWSIKGTKSIEMGK